MKVSKSDLNFLYMTLSDLLDDIGEDGLYLLDEDQRADIIDCIRITEHICAEHTGN